MHHRSFWPWVVTVACLLVPAVDARAGDDLEERAQQHVDRGGELVEQGSLEQARDEFALAYQLSPSAAVLWKLAEVHAALGQPLEALEMLEQYERDTGGELDAEQRAAFGELVGRLRRQVGEVAIDVEPAGATVFVDGKAVGRAPLDSAVRVKAGEHQVSAELEGYGPQVATVTAVGAERARVALRLEREERMRSGAGQLLIRCSVPGVEVAVGGKPIGKTPFFGPLGVPRGEHLLTFERPGYGMARKRVEVHGDEPARVACEAKLSRPLATAIAGVVRLELSDPEAMVEVDGLPWPDDGRLPAGPHVLTVRQPGSAPIKVDFTLQAGQQKALPIDLASMRGGDAVYATDTGPSAGRVMAWVAAAAGLAAGGTAVGLALWNDGRRDDWQSERDALDQARAAGTSEAELAARQSANDDLEQDVGTIDGLSIGLAVGGGALLLTGVILFVATGSADHEEQSLLLTPLPGGGRIGWRTAW